MGKVSFVLIIFFSPILTFFIHAFIIRLARAKPPQLTAVISVLIGNIPVFLISLIYICRYQIVNIERISAILYSLIVYNALAYTYFHMFNMSETARRVRILIELRKAGGLTREDILKKYRSEDIVNNRLDRLLDLKQLKLDNNKYKIDRCFLLVIAKMYGMWRQLLGYQKI